MRYPNIFFFLAVISWGETLSLRMFPKPHMHYLCYLNQPNMSTCYSLRYAYVIQCHTLSKQLNVKTDFLHTIIQLPARYISLACKYSPSVVCSPRSDIHSTVCTCKFIGRRDVTTAAGETFVRLLASPLPRFPEQTPEHQINSFRHRHNEWLQVR